MFKHFPRHFLNDLENLCTNDESCNTFNNKIAVIRILTNNKTTRPFLVKLSIVYLVMYGLGNI